MKIAIVDDERPARSELAHQQGELLADAQIDEGDSGAQALQMAGETAYDLMFLDINLGDISGTALVGALKKMQPQMKIIFVTAYSEYAVEAFELGVSDYVMKPFARSRLEKVLSRVLEKDSSQGRPAPVPAAPVPRRIAINTGDKTVFEKIEDIVYIETNGRSCLVHMSEDTYPDSRTIGEYEKKLSGQRFFRIHKSYLINLDKVRESFLWGSGSLGLKMKGYEQEILPVSREKSRQLKKLLED